MNKDRRKTYFVSLYHGRHLSIRTRDRIKANTHKEAVELFAEKHLDPDTIVFPGQWEQPTSDKYGLWDWLSFAASSQGQRIYVKTQIGEYHKPQLTLATWRKS